MDYEAKMQRLGEIVALLEGEKLSLEDASKLYAEGVALSEACRMQLTEIQMEIEKLQAPAENGEG